MKLRIEDMPCAHFARTVEAAIPRARVNYLKKEAEVIGEAPFKALTSAVEAAGYRAVPLEAQDG